MFNRHNSYQLEESYREQIIAKGKVTFVRREVGFSIVFFAMLMTLLYFVNGRTGSSLFASVAVFPIGVLGGYLHAIWRWQDITKNRP
jgi:hypothetical protein